MKKIIFFGTGSVAAELTSYLLDSDWAKDEDIIIKGYLASDDKGIVNWQYYKYKSPYLGQLADYQIKDEDNFVLALADPVIKRQIANLIDARGGKFGNLIHPSCTIASTAQIGVGNIFCPFVMLGPNVKMGNFNLLTSQSIISHDSIVGNYNFFATSLLCGHTSIGNDNYCGIRSTTIPSITIGDRNVIQAGMIVDKNVGDDATVFYRYKEKVMVIKQSKDSFGDSFRRE